MGIAEAVFLMIAISELRTPRLRESDSQAPETYENRSPLRRVYLLSEASRLRVYTVEIKSQT